MIYETFFTKQRRDVFSHVARPCGESICGGWIEKAKSLGLYDLIGNVDQFLIGNVDQFAMDVAPSSRTKSITPANDLAWADGVDPLFWYDEGIDGSGFFVTARLSQPWGELKKLYVQSGRRWRCLGFRIVAAPDLLAERKLKLRRL